MYSQTLNIRFRIEDQKEKVQRAQVMMRFTSIDLHTLTSQTLQHVQEVTVFEHKIHSINSHSSQLLQTAGRLLKEVVVVEAALSRLASQS